MTSAVCARCGCPATEYTASCRACYMRRRYRGEGTKETRPARQPVYTGRIAGRVPALNSLIPNRKTHHAKNGRNTSNATSRYRKQRARKSRITAKTYTTKPHPPEAETTVTATITTNLDGLYYLDYGLNSMAEEAGMY